MLPVVISMGSEALKSATVINGGSAAAILAFIGTGRQAFTSGIATGLKCFGVGLAAATFATGVSYVAQFLYARELEARRPVGDPPLVEETEKSRRFKQWGFWVHGAAILSAVTAFILAVIGLLVFADSVLLPSPGTSPKGPCAMPSSLHTGNAPISEGGLPGNLQQCSFR